MALPNPYPSVLINPHIETFLIAPGATTAGDDIDLPSGSSPIMYILAARTEASTGTNYTEQELTVVTYAAAPSSNEICVKDYNTVLCGNNTTTTTNLIIEAVCAPKGYAGAFNTLPNPYPKVEMEPHIRTIIWCPGAVNADTAFDLPTAEPPILAIIDARMLQQNADVITQTALTVIDYSSNPGTAEIAVVDYNSVICGTAQTAATLLILKVVCAPKGYAGSINSSVNPVPNILMKPHVETVVMYTNSAADTAFDIATSDTTVVSLLTAHTHASNSGVLTQQALTVSTYAADMSSNTVGLYDYNSVICGNSFAGTKTKLVMNVVCAPKGYAGSIKT